jgi:hypothetical protein
MEKALTQKNTLLKNAASYRTTNFFKRVFFSPTQEEIQIIFFPTLRFFNYLFSQHKILNWTDHASIVDKFEQSVCKLATTHLRADRRASANTGLAKVAVQFSADSLVVAESLVLRINICGKNRHLRQARKRYASC